MYVQTNKYTDRQTYKHIGKLNAYTLPKMLCKGEWRVKKNGAEYNKIEGMGMGNRERSQIHYHKNRL